MSNNSVLRTNTHVVDILGNVNGRDQPIMLMEKAIELISLLGEEILSDDEIVFFDPFCKAGEILLACAYSSCLAKSKRKILSLDEIQNELYKSNRYFALAPDERHHRLSLRTFLGNTHSHDMQFNHIIRDGHYLSEIDGRLDRDKFEKEFSSMIEYIKSTSKKKKIIAIGNPPYQESDGGFGGSATAVYNFFTEALMDSADISEVVLVIPSRWFTTGKGATAFRERVMKSKTIKTIQHFEHSQKVFPTVDVQGGVCFFHHKAEYNGDVEFIENSVSSMVNLSSAEIILDDPRGYGLIEKVKKNWKGEFVSKDAWPVRPFGIRTFYFDRTEALSEKHADAIPCFTKRRKIQYANIKDIHKNLDKIEEWKVAVPKAYAPGTRRVTLPVSQFFIIPKGFITTETYNVVGCFKKKSEAENFQAYLSTNFARYFLGLRKVTQDIYKSQWSWVPLMDVTQKWTDDQLYKLFKITKEEQEHIKKKLQEWS
ncbi:MAG: Eco57I restriction-modification methylase domain-containing protein [Bacteriovorax sp.]|nr:Eco57I restriction-modification methylase domain-containing protein [Bacteriovorax sp.]